MKIVMATPILYDSISPFNHLIKDIFLKLLEEGNEIIRIVAVNDINDESYKLGIESIKYIPIKRKKLKKSNIIKRYLVDTFTNIKMAKKLKAIGADILFEDVSYSSWCIINKAKKQKMKVVSMFQDVWPDNAVKSSLIGDRGFLYKVFNHLQKIVYKKSDRFICISEDMKKFIISKGADEHKIDVIYNWGYSDEPVFIKWENNEFVKKYNLDKNKFYVVYAGNIGKMQNVGIIIETAKQLLSEKDIRFLIIGDGSSKNEIMEEAKNISNISFLPFQPSSLATSIYSMAGANIIPLLPGAIKTALPSKTGVCLSCSDKNIFAFGRECLFASYVKEFKSGFCVNCDSTDEIVESIIALKSSKSDSLNREMFLSMFTKSINVNKYYEVFNSLS